MEFYFHVRSSTVEDFFTGESVMDEVPFSMIQSKLILLYFLILTLKTYTVVFRCTGNIKETYNISVLTFGDFVFSNMGSQRELPEQKSHGIHYEISF